MLLIELFEIITDVILRFYIVRDLLNFNKLNSIRELGE